MSQQLASLKSLRRYPSLLVGVLMIAVFVIVSIGTVIALPYDEAIRLWRAGPGVWEENPKTAMPAWVDYLARDKLSRTIKVASDRQGAVRVEPLDGENSLVTIELPLKYGYDRFPTELNLFTDASESMSISAVWHTPDGRTVTLVDGRYIRGSQDTYYISQDMGLYARLGDRPAHIGLFADPANKAKPLKGDYRLVLTGQIPRQAELKAKLMVYGEVHGLAGTDHMRRDLMIPLLWGAPIGIVFGLVAAVGTTLATFVLSAIGTWRGGKVDTAFQWVTQVNLIIPVLPVLIMVGYLYNRSIWLMLGLVIALNIFGAGMLTYRAMYLQAKQAPYIEAAQAYGAGDSRIIFRYLMPRLAPTLLPQLVLVIPTFVFVEASLSVLGLGDPVLPTWGKVIYEAYQQGALYQGLYYWIVEPAMLLMLVGVGFSLIGYSLDRIFNPKLRTV